MRETHASVGPGDAALRVVIADVDARFSERLEAALLDDAEFTCVGRASSGAEIVELVRAEAPDVAFVAADTPGAAAATRRILDQTAPPRLFLLSAEDEPDFHAGVSGYIRKGEDAVEVAGFVAALCPLTWRAVTPEDADDPSPWAQARAVDAS